MSSNISDRHCFECNEGTMEKIIPFHTYDFNKDGFVPLSCNVCGSCSDVEEMIPDTNVVKIKLSHNFIKRILKIVCNYGRTFDYKTRDKVLSHIKNQNIDSRYLLAERIMDDVSNNGYTVDFSFIINTIYMNLEPRFDFVA